MGHIRKKKAAQGDPPEHEQKIQEERQRIAEHLAPELRSWRAMKSLIAKRSVIIDGQKTSVSLEDPFWTDLKKIAHAQQMTLSALVAEIDGTREHGNLSSAIRLFVLRHVHYGERQMEEAKARIRAA
jgi:predicted DNA-binding ribbon-helix-helix protein